MVENELANAVANRKLKKVEPVKKEPVKNVRYSVMIIIFVGG